MLAKANWKPIELSLHRKRVTKSNTVFLEGLQRFSSVQFSQSVMSNSLGPHGLQHARPPCTSPTPGVYSNSCLLDRDKFYGEKHILKKGRLVILLLKSKRQSPIEKSLSLHWLAVFPKGPLWLIIGLKVLSFKIQEVSKHLKYILSIHWHIQREHKIQSCILRDGKISVAA